MEFHFEGREILQTTLKQYNQTTQLLAERERECYELKEQLKDLKPKLEIAQNEIRRFKKERDEAQEEILDWQSLLESEEAETVRLRSENSKLAGKIANLDAEVLKLRGENARWHKAKPNVAEVDTDISDAPTGHNQDGDSGTADRCSNILHGAQAQDLRTCSAGSVTEGRSRVESIITHFNEVSTIRHKRMPICSRPDAEEKHCSGTQSESSAELLEGAIQTDSAEPVELENSSDLSVCPSVDFDEPKTLEASSSHCGISIIHAESQPLKTMDVETSSKIQQALADAVQRRRKEASVAEQKTGNSDLSKKIQQAMTEARLRHENKDPDKLMSARVQKALAGARDRQNGSLVKTWQSLSPNGVEETFHKAIAAARQRQVEQALRDAESRSFVAKEILKAQCMESYQPDDGQIQNDSQYEVCLTVPFSMYSPRGEGKPEESIAQTNQTGTQVWWANQKSTNPNGMWKSFAHSKRVGCWADESDSEWQTELEVGSASPRIIGGG